MKTGFAPIQMNEYVKQHIKSNPGTSREEIETGLPEEVSENNHQRTGPCRLHRILLEEEGPS